MNINTTDENTNRFNRHLRDTKLVLSPESINTLQVNITKLCNQACRHCHVDSSPIRTEQMSKLTVDQCLHVLKTHPSITALDITGGAPELNPHFDYMVESAKALGKRVMVRHNLTVTFDGNPQTKEDKNYLPEFFAKNKVEVISSLPCYQEVRTDKQRGKGVFEKSIAGLKKLNALGYGKPDSGKILNLVYNPVGAFLPGEQASLESDYKKELFARYGIVFNSLFVITNMPIHRFKEDLIRSGNLEEYMSTLIQAFNPNAAKGIMCRSLISVAYDGTLYDCDFNQMLNLDLNSGGCNSIFNFNFEKLLKRQIVFDEHCFGCTAGSGSSCKGITA